ncbi:MAG: fcbC [Labilithrix sp.]|nr:fcbC [Labilithrix sp.]
MISHVRPVRFEDVDAARIVFFARFFNYAHDAMERLFDELPGGYSGLIMSRGLGFPAVHVEADYRAPLRYGDAAVIRGWTEKLGTTSAHLAFEMHRQSDGVTLATTRQVHVCTALDGMAKTPFPDDVRAALAAHLLAR